MREKGREGGKGVRAVDGRGMVIGRRREARNCSEREGEKALFNVFLPQVFFLSSPLNLILIYESFVYLRIVTDCLKKSKAIELNKISTYPRAISKGKEKREISTIIH